MQKKRYSVLVRVLRYSIVVMSVVAMMPLGPVFAESVMALDIKKLSLEELAQIDVYSASRRSERVQGVPSAVFVLTGDDIRRARVTNIPDALRLVPGVNVARVDGNKWGVSIRGYIGLAGSADARLSNKLLVLVDGRSIYDPLFGGTFWEAQDMVLADIDRIEVIRGPGGALWGANAVNGVINIITKHARNTQGGLVDVGGGTEERAFGAARYGWKMGERQHMRVYAKTHHRDEGYSPSGNAHDALHMYRTGFRWDADASARDQLRVSGDWFGADAEGRSSAGVASEVDHRGGNLLTHWQRKLSGEQSLQVQFYYDYLEFGSTSLNEERDTWNLELQHDFVPFARNKIVWGLGYRRTRDDIGASGAIVPTQRTDVTASAFVQDTIELVHERVNLTLGTKFENNDYTHNEWQPSARLAFTPSDNEAWWAAASRAVRIPTRLESDIVIGGTRLGEGMTTEKVNAYEIGHRRLLTRDLWFDLAGFYNDYEELSTIETGTLFKNLMQGHTKGVELATRWKVMPSWRVDMAYTYLRMKLSVDPPSAGQPSTVERSNPHYQFVLRSALDITKDVLFDATLRSVDDLPAINVPAYIALDLGVSWSPVSGLELSLVGQNLLDSHHPEQALTNPSTGLPTTATEVQRGYYAKLAWRF